MKPSEKRTTKKRSYLGESGYDVMEVGAAFPFDGPDRNNCHASRVEHIKEFFNQRARDYGGFIGTEEQWRAEWLPSKIPKM